MNVTLQTTRINNTYNAHQQKAAVNNRAQQPAFTGNVSNVFPAKSKLFKPFENAYDSLTDFIAKKFVGPAMDSGVVKWYALKTKTNKLMVNHINAVNSFVISGLYMYKTLTNKQMDKDRKKTLAINQGMTLGISTAGAYALDGSLNKWWGKVTQKYAAIHSGDKNLIENFKIAKNKGIVKDLEDYAIDVLKSDKLAKEIKAMDVAKKLLIFAMVYRYITPVLVTPIANKIGERLLEKKRERAEAEGSALSKNN